MTKPLTKNLIDFSAKMAPFAFVLIWSIGSIFIKIGLDYTNPFIYLLLRLVIASSFMLFLCFLTKAPWPNNWKSLRKIIIAGLLLQFSYLITFSCAVYYEVSPAIMNIILGLQPIFTAVIANYALKHSLTRYQWIGLLTGCAGVVLAVIGNFSAGTITTLGFIFSVACLAAMTLGSVFQKSITDMNLLTGTTIQLSVGIIPTAIVTALLGNFHIPTAPLFLVSLAWVSLVVSVGGTCIYYTLLKKGHIVSTTSLFYLVPPVTALLSCFALNTPLTAYMIFSLILIMTGIVMVKKSKPPNN